MEITISGNRRTLLNKDIVNSSLENSCLYELHEISRKESNRFFCDRMHQDGMMPNSSYREGLGRCEMELIVSAPEILGEQRRQTSTGNQLETGCPRNKETDKEVLSF